MRIVYIDMDCMRPDHFGGYGYHRNTTPNLDSIIRRGVRFTECHTSDSPCVPSRAALFSGRFGIHNGVNTHWGPGGELRADPGAPMFMRLLRQHGYRTVSFSSFADRHNAWWFACGWHELNTFTLKRGAEDADELVAEALPWFEHNIAQDDLFIHLNFWDPHRNYTMPSNWLERFRDEPPPAWPDQDAIDSHQDNYGPFSAGQLHPWPREGSPTPCMPEAIRTVDDWKQFVDGYDASIAFMDDQIGRLLGVMSDKGVLDDTVFILSCDHAEAMGEFGIYGDHVCACEGVHNIPMVVAWPGVTPPDISSDSLVYNVDLPPTVCELLKIPVPEGWDGMSFAPILRSGQSTHRDHLVWTHGLYSCQRVVRTPQWALTRTYHPGLFDFPEVQLHDIGQDRRQTANVAREHPEVVRNLDHLLMQWQQEQLGRPGRGVDPLQLIVQTGPWKYVRPEAWLSRLEEQDQGEAAARIRARLGLPDLG